MGIFNLCHPKLMGFPGGSVIKKPPAIAGDTGSIPQSGRSPGEGHGNPLQYSCLENSMERGAWGAVVHGVTKSQTWLNNCCRSQYLRNQASHSESWRTQVYYASRPRGVNTPSSEPRTKGLQSFYTCTGMIKQVCGALAIAKSKTRVSEISFSS